MSYLSIYFYCSTLFCQQINFYVFILIGVIKGTVPVAIARIRFLAGLHCQQGMHAAGVYDEAFRWSTNQTLLGNPIHDSLRFHKDLGKYHHKCMFFLIKYYFFDLTFLGQPLFRSSVHPTSPTMEYIS
jgi:hypothetical protein